MPVASAAGLGTTGTPISAAAAVALSIASAGPPVARTTGTLVVHAGLADRVGQVDDVGLGQGVDRQRVDARVVGGHRKHICEGGARPAGVHRVGLESHRGQQFRELCLCVLGERRNAHAIGQQLVEYGQPGTRLGGDQSDSRCR